METLNRSRLCGPLLIGLVILGTGCTGREPAVAETPPTSGPPASDLPAVLATIDGEDLTLDDIRAMTGDELTQMENSYRRARNRLVEKTLNEVIQSRIVRAEAQKQGKTPEELLVAEAGGTMEPSGVEARAWFDENRARTGGRAFEQIEPQILEHLRNERRTEAAQKLEARLRAEHNVVVHLEPMRLTLDNARAPTLGPSGAPLTLVEFSDFQCPFCNRFVPTLKQLKAKYGDQMQVVYRQYPITSLHPNAFKAAEASLCANDQGKFWEIHDAMFQQQNRLALNDLKALGGRLGLDAKEFNACLDSGKHAEQVQADVQAATRLGITGTPALFINGIPIEGGAVPYEVVEKAIDTELARLSN